MPFIGEIAALVAAFFWAFGALLFETAGRRIGAFQTNLLRILIGTILLSLTLYVQIGVFFPMDANQDNYFWLGLSGIVGLAIGDGALFYAIVILGPRLSTLLLSLAPPITTIVAWIFLGESLELLAVIGIVVTISAIAWVVSEKHGDEHIRGSKTLGVILGIVAALGQGIGVILAKVGLGGGIDSLSATLLRMLPATVALWGVAVLTRHAAPAVLALKDKYIALIVVIASIVGPFIGVWLSMVAVKYTETGIASTLLSTVPILLIPMELIIHKRAPSLRGILGAILAVIGVGLIFMR
jgi:drug/metabolite transporter (DMT)-like permease